MSVGEEFASSVHMSEKMKHTRDFKKKGFKGNTRGSHIQAPFATLEELFKKLPKDVGFNIELSMLAIKKYISHHIYTSRYTCIYVQS